MIKLFSHSVFGLLLFFWVSLFVNDLFAQKLDHRPGVICVQMEASANIENLVEANRFFKSVETNIQIEKNVSKPFHIWNISFNQNRINEIDFLEYIRQSPLVSNAQFDFWIEKRSPPNDPFYVFQYYFNNLGQNGGTVGVDINAQDAWETTTGGLTFFGDTIVLCIIDEGFERTHYDLQQNSWINHLEIPNNNIDEDSNGYVDDYYGWNVIVENDDVVFEEQIHGTQVAGIAGAVGNNNTGISGLNWNVKLMYVTRGYDFSDAVAAYTYPFEMRKLYNETNGEKGAFVVATNSSWGVNYGMPGDAPLWCAIYDSLGSVGVLSAAATVNLEINVDEQGDLPTTCPSDFLITATKLDNSDNLPPNAGYGAESIDLAAFGKNIFSTNINNGYSAFSGTSAAAPQVAGTIALLYSAPCPSFMELAKSQPVAACLLVKDYILDGIVDVDALQNITVTGGRLNTANSLQFLMDDCYYSGCYPPYSIVIEDVTNETVSIDWQTGASSTAVKVRYREVGETIWTHLNNISNPFTFSGLQPCTNYEFQLASICGPLTSNYSLSYEFQTGGCCIPPSMFQAQNINDDMLILNWDELPSAISYQIRYRDVGGSTWSYINTENTVVLIPNLTACTAYEFQIQSICPGGQTSDFSGSLIESTIGCSECVELPYCEASAIPMSYVWIKKVALSNLDYYSNNAIDGYSDHTDQTVNLIQGQSYEITLKSDGDFGALPGIFNVWIDFNQDGIFDNLSELILHSNSVVNTNKIIFIPTDAIIGSARMRVSFLEQNNDDPCTLQNLHGEVEDYCVYINEPTECLPPTNILYTTYENSVELSWIGNLFIESYLLKYRAIVDTSWIHVLCQDNQFVLNGLATCTDYEFEIQSICDGEPSESTEIHYFTTKGCGACLDNVYCVEDSAKAYFEWIQSVQLNTLNNISGSNNGFAYFDDFTTNLVKEVPYPLVIKPGFASGSFEEYYKVWIDLNQDGFFAESEAVYDSYIPLAGHVQSFITIPDTSLLGSTRMRVMMKFNNGPNSACDFNFFGEIEEYCINIVANEDEVCEIPLNVEVDPASITSFSAKINWEPISNAISYMLKFQKSDTLDEWNYIMTNNDFCNLYQLEECESYNVQIKTICEFGLSHFSEQLEFQTDCIVNTQDFETINTYIHLYPNPTQNNFFIKYHLNNLSKVSFAFYDVSGKLLEEKELPPAIGEQQQEFIFPEGSASGLYFLKVNPEGQKPTILKVIKTN